MDAIDIALTEAWSRLSARVQHDRIERLRRLGRRELASLARPIRPWCLAIRASDTRINRFRAEIGPYWDLPRHGMDHHVRIDAEGIKELCAPVTIDWPGIPVRQAARLLGRHPKALRPLANREPFELRIDFGRHYSKTLCRVPVVWSRRALDPGAPSLRSPHHVFGSLWMYRHTLCPADAVLDARRVAARNGFYHKWRFVCPGLNGIGCRRPADILFLPLREWTMPDFLGEDPLSPLPGPRPLEASAFACRQCHRVALPSFSDPVLGWNVFVARISRGLLYGREVERPATIRVRLNRAHIRRSTPERRARILALVLEGRSYPQIARALGVSRSTVTNHMRALTRESGVRTRRELEAAFGVNRLNPRRAAVAGLTTTRAEAAA
jgi:DNA-binding CsgD family transcriptional regulator